MSGHIENSQCWSWIGGTQDDGASWGMFCIAFLDHTVKGFPLNTISQMDILALRIATMLSLFANSTPIEDDQW